MLKASGPSTAVNTWNPLGSRANDITFRITGLSSTTKILLLGGLDAIITKSSVGYTPEKEKTNLLAICPHFLGPPACRADFSRQNSAKTEASEQRLTLPTAHRIATDSSPPAGRRCFATLQLPASLSAAA
jgi:hypothetical protein